jgi:hypothetical protein
MADPRLFTPDEANAALADVRPLAEELVARAGALRAAQAEQAELNLHIAGNGGDIAPTDLAEAEEAVQATARAVSEAIARLDELGVHVKDADTGLLDFPSELRGEPVLLCWRLGEDEVAFWHGLEDGYAGRRPLPFD